MTTHRDPDAVPTFLLALIALGGVGGLAFLPLDGLLAGIHPDLISFKLKGFALIGLSGLGCAAASRSFPRYMIRLGETQRMLITLAAGMALCFVGVVGLGFGALDGSGVRLPPLPAVAGPLTCCAAFVLLALRQREARRVSAMANRR
ncbi:MAG: hypothetical protein ACRCWO_12630 [Bosea sp. (in: a-proteobacteria)]